MASELAVAQYVPQTRSSWWKLQGVILEPGAAFREIDRQPNWLLPLLLLTLLSIGAWFVFVQRIGLETMALAELQESAQWEQMTPEAREHALAMSTGTLMQVIGYVPVTIGPAILLLVVSAAFLLGFSLSGANAPPFRKLVSVSTHAIFAYTLISTVLTVGVLLAAKDPQGLDINNLVHSNLAFLANGRETPVLTSLLASLDLLSFYGIYLLSLGNSIISRKSFGFSLTLTTVLWATYVVGKLAITALWS
ncbi:MAG: YIP1 family protein [Thermoanaerobaculia bacterium]